MNSNEYMAEYMLRRYHVRVAKAKTRLGGSCTVCGTTELLELDHIDWCNKAVAINKLWSISKKRFDMELEKCQLLCRQHHAQKSKADHLEWLATHGWKNQHGSGPLV
jgi:hypothetical protein